MSHRTLASLPFRLVGTALLVLCVSGCSLLTPSDEVVDQAMTPAAQGEIVRDQYGQYRLVDEPTVWERNRAILYRATGE